jgi:hypothetical protein
VSIVGLLAVGGALLTLAPGRGHDDGGRDGASVSVASGGYGVDVLDGAGEVPAPSVSVRHGRRQGARRFRDAYVRLAGKQYVERRRPVRPAYHRPGRGARRDRDIRPGRGAGC